MRDGRAGSRARCYRHASLHSSFRLPLVTRTDRAASGLAVRPLPAQEGRRAFIVPSSLGRCTGHFSRPARGLSEVPSPPRGAHSLPGPPNAPLSPRTGPQPAAPRLTRFYGQTLPQFPSRVPRSAWSVTPSQFRSPSAETCHAASRMPRSDSSTSRSQSRSPGHGCGPVPPYS